MGTARSGWGYFLPVKQVIDSWVFSCLVGAVGFDPLLLRPHRGDERAAGPEFVPHKVARFLGPVLGQPDRALAFQPPHDVGPTVFGRKGEEQVDVSGHQLAGLNPTMLRAVETFWEIFRDCKTLGFLQQSWRLSIWDS